MQFTDLSWEEPGRDWAAGSGLRVHFDHPGFAGPVVLAGDCPAAAAAATRHPGRVATDFFSAAVAETGFPVTDPADPGLDSLRPGASGRGFPAGAGRRPGWADPDPVVPVPAAAGCPAGVNLLCRPGSGPARRPVAAVCCPAFPPGYSAGRRAGCVRVPGRGDGGRSFRVSSN